MEENKNQFPLYPELSEEGKTEAQRLIDSFKEQLKKIAEDVITNLYVDVPDFIESDSWGNFRNTIMDGFKDYKNRKLQNGWDFKAIRQQIYKEYRDEIIPDLNQDLVAENDELKKQISSLNETIDFLRNPYR